LQDPLYKILRPNSVIHSVAAGPPLARWTLRFVYDRNRHSAKFYRIINELVTVLMIGVVILVTVKPF